MKLFIAIKRGICLYLFLIRSCAIANGKEIAKGRKRLNLPVDAKFDG